MCLSVNDARYHLHPTVGHCRVKLAHPRLAKPYSGLGYQAEFFKALTMFPLRSEETKSYRKTLIPSADTWATGGTTASGPCTPNPQPFTQTSQGGIE